MNLLAILCNTLCVNSLSRLKYARVRNSKLVLQCLFKINSLGFINGFKIENDKTVIVFLKYNNDQPAIRSIALVSKPSKKIFLKKKYIRKTFKGNNGFIIFSTDKGIMTDIECVYYNKGGKPLLTIS